MSDKIFWFAGEALSDHSFSLCLRVCVCECVCLSVCVEHSSVVSKVAWLEEKFLRNCSFIESITSWKSLNKAVVTGISTDDTAREDFPVLL